MGSYRLRRRRTAQRDPTLHFDEDDTANEAELSPPPDSSSVSSVNPDMLGDEIVVGTHANGDKHSPLRVTSDVEDDEMADVERKRPSSHYPKPANFPPNQRPGIASSSHVVLGVWRDSGISSQDQKHAVVGFMDSRDRLRTRIRNITRNGQMINSRLFPIPPGPGGSWVTFERIIFDDHLIGLDHNEVKEFVKIRLGNIDDNESPQEKQRADVAAVEEAKQRLMANPPPEPVQPLPVAYGVQIPAHLHSARPDVKRRRTGSAVGTIADRDRDRSDFSEHSDRAHRTEAQRLSPDNSGYLQRPERVPPTPPPAQPQPSQQQHQQQQQQQPQVLEPLDGTRPTRILVGCWSKSSAAEDRDRHAVYGILGANDMFRVKLVRETMDGRYKDGNFPVGAGALWIPYEDVKFLPHLAVLTRAEVKEYVRVRQSQIDMGEKDEDRVSNETRAVYDAQRRASMLAKPGPAAHSAPRQHQLAQDRRAMRNSPKIEPHVPGHELRHDEYQPSRHDLRHGARQEMPTRASTAQQRMPLHENETRQPEMVPLGHHPGGDTLEHVQNVANREVARIEASQVRNNLQNADRAAFTAVNTPQHHRQHFQDNVHRMQQVWVQQEQGRLKTVNEDTPKMHMGVKYERRTNGPFAGKLVSQGQIISIDGEDYVEYRVLTKPSFF
ncbi:hypothetical protein F4778DRAFT_446348 [Xylariomycetidae sp. FL2044]|nr:hypothetical protein F4778DRAFT_446348 [Xylariomycetidae sp. FL2044]